MASIRRHVVSGDIEKRIITGAIVDDNYCSQLIKMAKKHHFKIDFARTVFQWVEDYYRLYKKAPGNEIRNIFMTEQESLKEAEADLVREFLQQLSDNSDKATPYLVDQSRDYIRERNLDMLADRIKGELARGRIDEAEEAARSYSRISKDTSQWFNPLDVANVNQVFSENETNRLFRFPGALGDMAGYFERDWLVAFMAPMKRGKSFWLQELAIYALMAGLKVSLFSLEMNKIAISKRIYKRIAALASFAGDHKYPVFDCQRNQDGSCRKDERACSIGIKAPGGKTPEFKIIKGYRPCQVCRGKSENNYVLATWWLPMHQTKDFDSASVARKVKHFKTLYGDNFRVMSYPAFSASFDDCERDLDELEDREGFVSDVIAHDYFDISAPGSGTSGFSERGVADYVWKRGKGLASRRHALMATVLQSNRKSISKKSLEQEDTAEDIRKLAHVDELFGVNQTPEEKDQGVSRISTIAHRHEEFTFLGEVMVLQSLALGQPFLEDQWIKII